MNERKLLDLVDQLLAAAAADPDNAATLLKEAIKVLRTIREQRELEAMTPAQQYLYNQQNDRQ